MAVREWEISGGDQQAVICARGGALRSYALGGDRSRRTSVVDGFAPEELPPAFNGAVLAPWPNRIRDGRWRDGERSLQLPVNEVDRGTALHGLVMWADWQLIEHTADAVQLSCRVAPQPGYPFELDLSVTWSLGPGGLTCELGARNTGERTAPFGIGTHPFFGFPEAGVDDLELGLGAARWQRTDDRLLPVTLEAAEGTALDFQRPRSLDGVVLDTAFTDLERDEGGRSSVTLARRGRPGTITVWAEEQFSWWQIYTSDMFGETDPRYRRSVAIEAMTCGPDSFNSGQDVIELQPGADWCGRWGVTVSEV